MACDDEMDGQAIVVTTPVLAEASSNTNTSLHKDTPSSEATPMSHPELKKALSASVQVSKTVGNEGPAHSNMHVKQQSSQLSKEGILDEGLHFTDSNMNIVITDVRSISNMTGPSPSKEKNASDTDQLSHSQGKDILKEKLESILTSQSVMVTD